MVNVIDYMPGDTLLHRLNPVIKLGLAATIIIGIFLSDTYVALLGFLALTLALGAYAGVVDRLLALLKLLIPLALIMLVLQLAFMRMQRGVELCHDEGSSPEQRPVCVCWAWRYRLF